MVEDTRTSMKPRSEVVTIESGDTAAFTALSLRPEETMAVEEIRVQYGPSGTANSSVELFDSTEVDDSYDLSDKLDKFIMQPGDEKNPDMEWDDIEENVVIQPDGNSDGPIVVTIGGYITTG